MDPFAQKLGGSFVRFLVIVGLSITMVALTWLDARMIGILTDGKGNKDLYVLAFLFLVCFTFYAGIGLLCLLWGHLSEEDYSESPEGHINISAATNLLLNGCIRLSRPAGLTFGEIGFPCRPGG
jgi:hypothetical protein